MHFRPSIRATSGCFLALSVLFIAAMVWAGGMPQFDTHAVQGVHAFPTEVPGAPLTFEVQIGGNAAASDFELGEDCRGYIRQQAANVRVHFTQTGGRDLVITLHSAHRNSLIINGSDGMWYCAQSDDDRVSTLRIGTPNTGQLDIWTGNFRKEQSEPGTLKIRAVAANKASSLPRGAQ